MTFIAAVGVYCFVGLLITTWVFFNEPAPITVGEVWTGMLLWPVILVFSIYAYILVRRRAKRLRREKTSQ